MARFNVKQKKKNTTVAPNVQKKKAEENQKLMFEDDDEEDDSDDDDVEMEAVKVKGAKMGGMADDDEEEDDDDDEEDDDDDDDEDEDESDGEEDEDEEDDSGDESDADVDALMDQVLGKAKGKTLNKQQTPGKTDVQQQSAQGKKVKKGKQDSEGPATQKLKRPAEDDSVGPQQKKSKTIAAIPSEIAASEQERRDARDKRTLFLKGFPSDATVEEIKELSPDIIDVRKLGKKNAMYAFLEFKSEQMAEKNIKQLRTKTLRNEDLQVDFVGCKSSRVQDRQKAPVPICLDKLYISGLSNDVTQKDLQDAFPSSTIVHITKPNKSFRSTNKIAFVSFANEKEAAEVYNASTDKVIKGKVVTVFFAKDYRQNKAKKRSGGGAKNGAPFKKDKPASQVVEISPTEIQRTPGIAGSKEKQGGKFEKKRNRKGGAVNKGGPGGGFGGRGGGHGNMGLKLNPQNQGGANKKKRQKKKKSKEVSGGSDD